MLRRNEDFLLHHAENRESLSDVSDPDSRSSDPWPQVTKAAVLGDCGTIRPDTVISLAPAIPSEVAENFVSVFRAA